MLPAEHLAQQTSTPTAELGNVLCAGNLGQNSMDLIKYFQGVEGAGSLPAGLNPATWMLQVGVCLSLLLQPKLVIVQA